MKTLTLYTPRQLTAESMERLRLDRRAKLDYSHGQLSALSARLAAQPDERRLFASDPVQYLSQHGVTVAAASLTAHRVGMDTSEACTAALVCAFVVAFAVDTLAIATASVSVVVQVAILAGYWCSVGVWGCGADNKMIGLMVQPPGSGGSMTSVTV